MSLPGRFRPLPFALLGVAAVSGLPEPAAAQYSIGFEVRSRGNRALDDVPAGLVNLADCTGNETWTFRYTPNTLLSAVPGAQLGIYIGSGCNERDNRTRVDDLRCFEVERRLMPTAATEFTMNARRLVGRTEEACTTGQGTNKLWVLGLDDDADETTLAYATLDVPYDTQPPSPPTGIGVGFGDGRARVTWATSTSDSDEYNRFRVVCDRSSGGGDGDAGTDAGDGGGGDDAGDGEAGDAAGDGEGGATAVGCTTPAPFAAGDTLDLRWDCSGEITQSTVREREVTGLTNYVEYHFAVVAYDKNLNPSVLSVVVCATPEDLEDFWDEYRDAGGQAMEGCECRAAGAGARGEGRGAFLVLPAIALLLWRRRGRREAGR
jgi:hypothetical protein